MIEWSISAALSSNLFDDVLVSTDCEEIANLSIKCGATIEFIRPKTISNDNSTIAEVIDHSYQFLKEKYKSVGALCTISAVCPFIRREDLINSFLELTKSKANLMIAVAKFESPLQRALSINALGYIEMDQKEKIFVRTQDLAPMYYDASHFYWAKEAALAHGYKMFKEDSIPFILPKYLVCDIDDEDDWLMAELMFKALIAD